MSDYCEMAERLGLRKRKRIVDEKLLEEIRTFPCLACLKTPCAEVHHVTTVKAGGDDVPTNLMPLCHEHHMEVHQGGWLKAMGKYPRVRRWLEAAGRQDVIERAERSKT